MTPNALISGFPLVVERLLERKTVVANCFGRYRCRRRNLEKVALMWNKCSFDFRTDGQKLSVFLRTTPINTVANDPLVSSCPPLYFLITSSKYQGFCIETLAGVFWWHTWQFSIAKSKMHHRTSFGMKCKMRSTLLL